mgnify:CR=1 FL=1
MTLSLPAELVEPFVGGLMAGIDVDGGPTNEQISVLRAITTHVWTRPDLDPRAVPGRTPSDIASLLRDDDQREMFHELHMTLEACRHPQSPAQVDMVQAYADALGVEGDDLQIFQDLITEGVDSAKDDYARFLASDLAERSEPSLRNLPFDAAQPEPELAQRLGAFAEYAPDSLGRAYVAFYERFNLKLPGVEASSINHFFVAHDMTHVIAGLSTTAAGEVALSAFQFAMNNSRINRAALLASLIAHEAGFAQPDHLRQADTALLAGQPAAQLLGEEMRRGGLCAADFSLVDHFELAPIPLAQVRAEFGVRPPVEPNDGHHIFW